MRLMWDTHTTAHGIHSSDPAPYLSGRAFTVFFVCSREDRQNPGPPAACPCLLVRPSLLQPCIVVDGTRMVSSARLKSFVTGSGLPVILPCKETGAERHCSSLPYESASVQGLEWALEPPLRSLFSTRLNTWNCATADRTISFRQVAPQWQLDC